MSDPSKRARTAAPSHSCSRLLRLPDALQALAFGWLTWREWVILLSTIARNRAARSTTDTLARSIRNLSLEEDDNKRRAQDRLLQLTGPRLQSVRLEIAAGRVVNWRTRSPFDPRRWPGQLTIPVMPHLTSLQVAQADGWFLREDLSDWLRNLRDHSPALQILHVDGRSLRKIVRPRRNAIVPSDGAIHLLMTLVADKKLTEFVFNSALYRTGSPAIDDWALGGQLTRLELPYAGTREHLEHVRTACRKLTRLSLVGFVGAETGTAWTVEDIDTTFCTLPLLTDLRLSATRLDTDGVVVVRWQTDAKRQTWTVRQIDAIADVQHFIAWDGEGAGLCADSVISLDVDAAAGGQLARWDAVELLAADDWGATLGAAQERRTTEHKWPPWRCADLTIRTRTGEAMPTRADIQLLLSSCSSFHVQQGATTSVRWQADTGTLSSRGLTHDAQQLWVECVAEKVRAGIRRIEVGESSGLKWILWVLERHASIGDLLAFHLLRHRFGDPLDRRLIDDITRAFPRLESIQFTSGGGNEPLFPAVAAKDLAAFSDQKQLVHLALDISRIDDQVLRAFRGPRLRSLELTEARGFELWEKPVSSVAVETIIELCTRQCPLLEQLALRLPRRELPAPRSSSKMDEGRIPGLVELPSETALRLPTMPHLVTLRLSLRTDHVRLDQIWAFWLACPALVELQLDLQSTEAKPRHRLCQPTEWDASWNQFGPGLHAHGRHLELWAYNFALPYGYVSWVEFQPVRLPWTGSAAWPTNSQWALAAPLQGLSAPATRTLAPPSSTAPRLPSQHRDTTPFVRVFAPDAIEQWSEDAHDAEVAVRELRHGRSTSLHLRPGRTGTLRHIDLSPTRSIVPGAASQLSTREQVHVRTLLWRLDRALLRK